MTWNWTTIALILSIIGWIIPVIMLFIVPVNRKPSSATAWLMLIFLLPYVGLLIFLILGSPKLSRRRRAQQHTIDDILHTKVEKGMHVPELAPLLDPAIPARYEPFVQLNTNLGKLPALTGNSVELLPDYHDAIKRIAQEVDRAQKFVHVEYFTLSRDDDTECFFAALERAQQRGVKVRVLIDQLGSRKYPYY